jgi:hypothetical protein
MLPEICASSNSRSRATRRSGTGPGSPPLSADADVSFVIGPLHLDPGHRTQSEVDASSIETVTELVHATGLSQWNTIEVVPVAPVADLMGNLDAVPIVFG